MTPPSTDPVANRHTVWSARAVRAWDRTSLYLPVLLMGALALGSYWLVRQNPLPALPSVAPPPTDEPDYFMQDFAIRAYHPQGALQHELKGHEIRHFPGTGHTEVDHARLRSVSAQNGRLTHAKADQLRANGDQTVFQLQGNVVLVREPGGAVPTPSTERIEFQGRSLELDTHTQRAVSPDPVQLVRGADRVSADRLDYDDAQGVAVLQGRVRATLPSRP